MFKHQTIQPLLCLSLANEEKFTQQSMRENDFALAVALKKKKKVYHVTPADPRAPQEFPSRVVLMVDMERILGAWWSISMPSRPQLTVERILGTILRAEHL
jgi:hypothetical protein